MLAEVAGLALSAGEETSCVTLLAPFVAADKGCMQSLSTAQTAEHLIYPSPLQREKELVRRQIELAEEVQTRGNQELAYRLPGNAHEDVLTALKPT